MSIPVFPPDHNGGSRPVPDPTILTTAQLLREIEAVNQRISGEVRIIEERLEGIDTATNLRLQSMDHFPDRIDEKVHNLGLLTEERFTSVESKFVERDTRSERESRDNKVAVDAAFAAQKEAASEQNKSNTLAIAKSETATTETINKLSELVASNIKGLEEKYTELARRFERSEGTDSGVSHSKELSTRIFGVAISGIAVVVIATGIIVSALIATGH